MHALVVVAHPQPGSFSHRVARRVADGIAQTGHTSEIADLAAEGFDPRFTAHDHAVHKDLLSPSSDVLREQQRIDGADALVLVYPVYWWSFPALLKGWIDRVFSNGWAYEERADTGLVKRLGHLPVHLVAIGGASERTYTRRGYFQAMKTQIDLGIFDYCGARVAASTFLLAGEDVQEQAQLQAAQTLGAAVFSGSGPVAPQTAKVQACA
ncbi:MAG: flavodoxin family protein [Hydrogenophaga sp.]|uniref:NAD(P)H-dependent oxidoreductase n=1 Tax=Hydrogenophaga sp. TaxID=1904254 RepID=UPI0016B2B224|nr:NAD(P)H-dependent oxidoreductase [Hydrogenophaga sp.]NIM40138.1 flavodoxin family protein [Hydrogenophaga sp.]NIN25372.1 flavodoxin family protein [Hydrogenophaga sp.]NIN32229.1 flavodoxin family protein [Hydrogenophaga sp.]NIN56478.1 flavodoxin family protein [Hydrogenophaga sp.]NIO52787.1 flavodoxin family protein [Hydrogenophaga sp.]